MLFTWIYYGCLFSCDFFFLLPGNVITRMIETEDIDPGYVLGQGKEMRTILFHLLVPDLAVKGETLAFSSIRLLQ